MTMVDHDLDRALPALGAFDAVVSSFAIHHVGHERKRALYAEIYGLLLPGAIFLNVEHVASPNASLRESFLRALGCTDQTEDPSNKLLDLELQLGWLRDTKPTVSCEKPLGMLLLHLPSSLRALHLGATRRCGRGSRLRNHVITASVRPHGVGARLETCTVWFPLHCNRPQ